MAIRRWTAIFGRAGLALLLLVAALSPSVAESGHFEDAIVHQENSAFQHFVEKTDPTEQKKPSPIEKGAHCGFSHCAHVSPTFPVNEAPLRLQATRLSYVTFNRIPLTAANLEGPDHPPRV